MDLQEVELHHRSFKALGQSCENTLMDGFGGFVGFYARFGSSA